jgi:MFS superfamily sulfate permease-like transporter
VEFVEEGAAPARRVSGGGTEAEEEAEETEELEIEETEAEFAEDLAAQQAQAAQTERIAREQSRVQALKRASQQAEAIQKNLQQTKRIWRSVNAANAAHGSVDIGGLLLTLATMNVQFINKYFFKTPMIPETSFPYEDGIVVAADLIIIIFTMLVLAIVIGAIGIIPAIISNLPSFLKSSLTGSP